MTITASGYSGGPMTELQWAMTAGGGPRFDSVGDCQATQPDTSARTVRVAAGSATASGVRITSDAPISQALTAPGSGGAWYLLTWRRTWSPTKTATLQVLGGPTTGSTTAPGTVPTAMPAGFVNNPGVQADQPIAWVWVSSASTTLVLADARLISTGGGTLLASSIHALVVANYLLADGVELSLQSQPTANGLINSGLWRRIGGTFQAVGDHLVTDSAYVRDSSSKGAAKDLSDLITSAYGAQLALHPTMTVRDNNARSWRWDGAYWKLVAGERTFTHLEWRSATDPIANPNNWTIIPLDTTVYDGLGGWNGSGLVPPVAGRYAVEVRVSITADDLTARYMLAATDLNTNTDLVWMGQVGMYNQTPMILRDELVLNPGHNVAPRLYRNSTGSQWIKRGDQEMSAPKMIIRYLGPV